MQVGVPEELCGSWAIGKNGVCFACGCGKRGATPFQKCLMQIWSTISCHFLAWWLWILWCFRHVSWKCQEDRNKARIELQGIIQHHFPGAHTLGRWCLDAVRLLTSKKVMKQTCRGWLLYSSQIVLPRPSRTQQIWKIVFFQKLVFLDPGRFFLNVFWQRCVSSKQNLYFNHDMGVEEPGSLFKTLVFFLGLPFCCDSWSCI